MNVVRHTMVRCDGYECGPTQWTFLRTRRLEPTLDADSMEKVTTRSVDRLFVDRLLLIARQENVLGTNAALAKR